MNTLNTFTSAANFVATILNVLAANNAFQTDKIGIGLFGVFCAILNMMIAIQTYKKID
jgi:hypothetical protein